MADQPDTPGGEHRYLDASGPRDVVFCHQCNHEWYQDEHGLICPRCESEITEIITPESDPRPGRDEPPSLPDYRTRPDEFRSLRDHSPWAEGDSDPDEADIEETITHGPGGSVLISRTIRSSTPYGRRHHFPGGHGRLTRQSQDDPSEVMRDFQSMLGNLMGASFRPGQAGRSNQETLFTPGFGGGGFRLGGDDSGPHVIGGRFTYTSGLRPRADGQPAVGGPPVDNIATLIGALLAPPGVRDHGERGVPPGLQGLFSALLNPANARSGDAVYSQEALDRIISTLMEQHPTSNAPGPASPDAIAALPKKKLDEKLLGPEGKGECSVCMDDVNAGDEVVVLPCSHWFHETCAGAWLSEHNTCPICRKGIEGETIPPNNRRSSTSGPTSQNEHRNRRLNIPRPRVNRDSTSSRNEARLDAIRNTGRLGPDEEQLGWNHPRRQIVGNDDLPPRPQRRHSSFRRRDVEMSEDQRDNRRGHTSGSDRSREPRRSSQGGTSGGSGGGITGWFNRHWPSN